jgi:EAL domain-containing protein (putative c-di-GMP-specific phosphodiesterase class I)
MNREVLNRQKFEQILRKAMAQGEFLLHYQPIRDLITGSWIGLEALLRWRHPTRGPVSAARLMPIAEETALIVPIGEWVLKTACDRLRSWIHMGLSPAKLSVNVSGRQFKELDLAQKVLEVIEASDVPPACLELELTESVAMEDFDFCKSVLRKLKSHGLTIAVDDFGTGYSSLSYLREFPVDRIKIDRSFMGRIASDPYDQELVKAIVAVAHSRNLQVIAEGIENRHQLDFLRGTRCDAGQGYLLGRPSPALDIEKCFVKQNGLRPPKG